MTPPTIPKLGRPATRKLEMKFDTSNARSMNGVARQVAYIIHSRARHILKLDPPSGSDRILVYSPDANLAAIAAELDAAFRANKIRVLTTRIVDVSSGGPAMVAMDPDYNYLEHIAPPPKPKQARAKPTRISPRLAGIPYLRPMQLRTLYLKAPAKGYPLKLDLMLASPAFTARITTNMWKTPITPDTAATTSPWRWHSGPPAIELRHRTIKVLTDEGNALRDVLEARGVTIIRDEIQEEAPDKKPRPKRAKRAAYADHPDAPALYADVLTK